MTLAHGLGLLLLGLILSVAVFWLVSIAEHKERTERQRTALDDFNHRQDG